MLTVRYHNRNAAGQVFAEIFMPNHGRFYADMGMGFIALPEGDIGAAHARSLGLEPMEGMPQIPVALADPRIIEQHADACTEYESRIEELGRQVEELRAENAALGTANRDLLADKQRLLKNYDGALEKVAASEPVVVVKR